MKLKLIAACVFALAVTPAVAAPSHKTDIALAKKVVMAQLRDPESARWGDKWAFGHGAVVCGSVNSKNAFGGYTGSRTFIMWLPPFEDKVEWISYSGIEDKDAESVAYFRTICGLS